MNFENSKLSNREEKSLRYLAIVAKFLDDSKPKTALESKFALFQTSLILFNVIIKFVKYWRNLELNPKGLYLSLEKEKENFCVVFTYGRVKLGRFMSQSCDDG